MNSTRGQNAAARELYTKSRDLFRQLVQENGADRKSLRELVLTLDGLAETVGQAGDTPAATVTSTITLRRRSRGCRG